MQSIIGFLIEKITQNPKDSRIPLNKKLQPNHIHPKSQAHKQTHFP